MATELIIFHRPTGSGKTIVKADDDFDSGSSAKAASGAGKVKSPGSDGSSYLDRTSSTKVPPSDTDPAEYFTTGINPNDPVSPVTPPILLAQPGPQGLRVDLYDEISIPITYTILDIREPDKKKTNWTKSLTIPGTKNNNRIFNHIYDITKDGWVTIGNYHVYQGFNPNLRKEVIIMQDGIQVFKGNLQLKKVTKREDHIEYDINLSGDLTSLFFDVGNSVLADLDFSEWDHAWSKKNIEASWQGLCKRKDGSSRSNITTGTRLVVKYLFMDTSTRRLGVETVLPHGFSVGQFVKCEMGTGGSWAFFDTAKGTWCVAEVLSTTRFTFNTPFPISLASGFGFGTERPDHLNCLAMNNPYGVGDVYSVDVDGTGYVYPLISWGDEYDVNSWPVTSMAPAYFMKEIWDKIFKKTNSTYTSNFLNSQFFKRLIVIQKKSSYELSAPQIQERAFKAGNNQERTIKASNKINQNAFYPMGTDGEGGPTSVTTPAAPPIAYNLTSVPGGTLIQGQKYPFYIDSGFINTPTASVYFGDGVGASGSGVGGNWNTDTYVWTVKKSGEYSLNCEFMLDSWADMDGCDGIGPQTNTFTPGLPGTGTGSGSLSITASVPRPQDLGPAGTQYCFYRTGAWDNNTGVLPPPTLRVSVIMMRQKAHQTSPVEYSIGSADFTVVNNVKYTHTGATAVGPGSAYLGTATQSFPYFGRYQPTSWKGKPLSGGSGVQYFSEKEKVWIEIKYIILNGKPTSYGGIAIMRAEKWVSVPTPGGTSLVTNMRSHWYLRIRGKAGSTSSEGFMSLLYNNPAGKSTENSDIYAKEFLPKDMTCKDYLNNIIKMFNLHILPDPLIEKRYTIEPRDDFYRDGSNGISDYVDWTSRLNEPSVVITPLGELLSKTYTFSNKAETDYWNKRFKDERGRDYMSYMKSIENDFLKNDTKISTTFGSTVMINNPEHSDVVMPAILQREENGSTKVVSNTAPRVLIWVGDRPYSKPLGAGLIPTQGLPQSWGYYGWELLSSHTIATQSATASYFRQIPYAGTVDSPLDPYYDINWFNMEANDFVYWDFARWTNNNLYNAYWKNFIEEVSDPSSLLFEAEFDLSPADINQLDFRKIYVVSGVYYRLQKIKDYDAVKPGLTKVELLKLKSPTRFVPRSIYPYEKFSVEKDYTRAITTTVTYGPPRIKRYDKGGDYNNTLPQDLGNGTINVTGLANHIVKGKNIQINGNENLVGHGAQYINISGGDGNSIDAGVKNVNMVGTSNKRVTEDNTSYINNVRYKDGIPISRCNVIDAGEISSSDVVLGFTMSQVYTGAPGILITRINRNSTITVVDAGEDITTTRGTSTYENVINAGSDAILPDIVELGLSTRTVPNPRTNYSGPADFASPTMSMVDLVRSNFDQRQG